MIKLWNWLDGKKSKIALIYWSVVIPALPVIFDKGVPDNVSKVVTIIGLALSGLGLGHATIKAINKE